MRVPLGLAVALLVVVLLVPSSATARPGMEMAVQDDSVFVAGEYYSRDKGLEHAQRLRASHVRVNVLWGAVVGSKSARSRKRPRKIRYDFTSYDLIVAAAQRRGIEVQMALTGPAPAWATRNRKRGPYKPNAKLFAHFVKATVRHFHMVTRYSIWNEPNHVGWLAPVKSQASLYRSLYKAGYKAVKKTNKGAQVLIGETAPYARNKRTAQPPLKFLRALVRKQRLRADGYAHHPYEYQRPPNYRYPGKDNVTIGTLDRLTKALDKYAKNRSLRTPGGRPLDVWLTEFGYFRVGRYKLSDAKRGEYLRQAWQIAWSNPRVRQMLHFLLIQPPKKYRFFDTSIISRKGKESGAFGALASWAQQAYAPPPPPGGGGGGGGGGGSPPPPPPPCYLPGTTIPCP